MNPLTGVVKSSGFKDHESWIELDDAEVTLSCGADGGSVIK